MFSEYDDESVDYSGFIKAISSLPIQIVKNVFDKICDEIISQIISDSNTEIDGEIYGHPDNIDLWDYEIRYPHKWMKRDQNNGNS